ncbi:MAG: hypothetical protein AB7L09_21415 [Nitrospira sp.]
MLNYVLVMNSEKSELAKIFKDKKHRDVTPDDLPNRKAISDNEIWRKLSSFSPKEWTWGGTTEWNGEYGTLLILYAPAMSHAGGGYAIWSPYSSRDCSRKPDSFKAQYFSWIQCMHDWKSKNIGNCLNQYTCEKCGTAFEVDSSG